MIRRTTAALLAVALSLVATPVMAQDLGSVVVTDEPSGASVALQAEAQQQTQQDPASGIEIRFYLAISGDIGSTLSAFEISDATGGYDIDLGVQGSAAGSSGTMVSCTPLLHQGFPARDFQLAVTDANGNQGTLYSRIVYTGEHVVQVQALGSDSRAADIAALFQQLITTLDIPATAGPSPVPGSSLMVPTACMLTTPGASPGASVAPAG